MAGLSKGVFDLLDDVYYKTKSSAGFASQIALFNEAKKRNKKLTLEDVKKWWMSRRTPSRFGPAKKKFLHQPFITRAAHDTYSGDMADLSKLSSKNKGFKWFLIIMDLFTRQIKMLQPQRSKSSKETASSLEKLFTVRAPRVYLTDRYNKFMWFNDTIN